MGCASSGPLPFLSNRANEAVAEPSRMNGELPYEVTMASDSPGESGVANMGEDFPSRPMQEAVDSTVENVMGALVQKKEEIVDQVEGLGDAVADKLTSAADSVQERMESAFQNLTGAVETLEDKLTTEVTSMGENIKSVLAPAGEPTAGEMKADDIDELLDSLPTESEVAEVAAAAAAAAAAAVAAEEKVEDEPKGGNGE